VTLRRRLFAIPLLSALLAGWLAAAPAGAAAASPPTVGVTPTSGLVSGDMVTVVGSGYRPADRVGISQCGADQRWVCSDLGALRADGQGDLRGTVPVADRLGTWLGDVDCRVAPGACELVIGVDAGEVAFVPLDFAAPGPPLGRYLDHGFEVEVERDVVYRTAVDRHGDAVDLVLDLYRPAGDTAVDRPAVVWLHGGFFESGHRRSMEVYARDLAARGYLSASVQYRLRPRSEMAAAIGDALEDAAAAVGWLRDHAGELGIDGAAIAVGGYSAGGVTAHNLAYGPDATMGERSPVAAAISVAGLRSVGVPEPGEPPLLAFHGSEDLVVPYAAGRAGCDDVRAASLVCELVTWEGAGHEIPSERQVSDRTAAFLAEHLLAPLGKLERRPTASAGGPYVLAEGSSVRLDGAGSPSGSVSFAWSPGTHLDDPAGATPAFLGVDDGEHPLTLTVAGAAGSASASTVVTVTNEAPSIGGGSVRPAGAGGRGRLAQRLRATVTDPGLADTHRVVVDWGDGSVTAGSLERHSDRSGEQALSGDHRYRRAGVYTVSVTVEDDDGGTTTWSATADARPRPVGTATLSTRLGEVAQRLLGVWWLVAR
jgi:acetyl esterase/lipase